MDTIKKIKKISLQNKNSSYTVISDYILENLNTIQTISIDKLAKRSNTSPSTITRYCKELGFDGFKQLIPNIVSEIKFLNSTETEFNWENKHEVFDFLETHKNTVINSIEQGFIRNNQKIKNVVDLFVSSRFVYLFSVGGNCAFMMHLENLLSRVGIPSFYSPDIDQQQAFMLNVTENDCVFILDYTLHKRQIENIIQHVKKTNCKKIALTKNITDSQLTDFDIVLDLAKNESMFQGRRMADVNTLFTLEQINNAILMITGKIKSYKKQDRD